MGRTVARKLLTCGIVLEWQKCKLRISRLRMDVRADVVQLKILIRTESVTIRQKAGSDEMKKLCPITNIVPMEKGFWQKLEIAAKGG